MTFILLFTWLNLLTVCHTITNRPYPYNKQVEIHDDVYFHLFHFVKRTPPKKTHKTQKTQKNNHSVLYVTYFYLLTVCHTITITNCPYPWNKQVEIHDEVYFICYIPYSPSLSCLVSVTVYPVLEYCFIFVSTLLT